MRLTAKILIPLVVTLLAACGGGGSPSNQIYTISGNIDHLSGNGLTLSDGVSTLSVDAGATSFIFPEIGNGGAYNITVVSQPTNENCVVSNGSGIVTGTNISNVDLACNTAISDPIAIGLYPVAASQTNASRVFVPVTMVGNNNVAVNAVLDTGSAGVVLNAFNIFPPSIVTSSGFNFPSGQSSITYNGITVTNIGATKSFGGQSSNPTTHIGNIGFAQVNLGANGGVTTAVIPILFVYQRQSNGSTSQPNANASNIVGINAAINTVKVTSSTSGGTPVSTVCSVQSTTDCGLISPLRSLTYAQGIDTGFVLRQFALQNCNINIPGSCQAQPLLTIGLNDNVSSGFNLSSLNCGISTTADGSNINTCSQVISNVNVSSGDSTFNGNVIFDSGAPTTRISVPVGSVFPQSLTDGTQVSFNLPSGFSYQYATGVGPAATTIVQGGGANAFSNTGIQFFTQHSLLVDFSSGLEGWQ